MPVLFPIETGALLGLPVLPQYRKAAVTGEFIKQKRLVQFMVAQVIHRRELYGRPDLHRGSVARIHLGLHQKVTSHPTPLHQKTNNAGSRGAQHRLAPGYDLPPPPYNRKAQDAEKAVFAVPDGAVRRHGPFRECIHRFALDKDVIGSTLIVQPLQGILQLAWLPGGNKVSRQHIEKIRWCHAGFRNGVDRQTGTRSAHQTGQHATAAGMQQVVPSQETADLTQGQPDEGIARQVGRLVQQHDHVAVGFIEKATAILGLQFGKQDPLPGRVEEILQQGDRSTAMGAGVVAVGSLYGGRKLERADISRLFLGLQAKMQHSVDRRRQNAENAHFRLVDGRLVPDNLSVRGAVPDSDTGDRKKAA